MALSIIVLLVLLLPFNNQQIEVETEPVYEQDISQRYYITEDHYYDNEADYEEAMRQRDEYYRQQAKESARQTEEFEKARVEYEEAMLKEAESKLEFSKTCREYPNPFNDPPITWRKKDLKGFKMYQIPEEYEREGGYFPDIIQEYTWVICKDNDLEYDKMVALFEGESGYRFDIVGRSGDSGYGQIIPKYNKDLMEKLGVTDLLNPYQNVLVACSLMRFLLDKYDGSYEKALTAYNAGTGGAYSKYFSAGVNASPYAKGILKRAERIRKELNSAAKN